MAGYMTIVFLGGGGGGVFMDRDGVEINNTQRKKTILVSSHLDRTSFVNKGFIYVKRTAGHSE